MMIRMEGERQKESLYLLTCWVGWGREQNSKKRKGNNIKANAFVSRTRTNKNENPLYAYPTCMGRDYCNI